MIPKRGIKFQPVGEYDFECGAAAEPACAANVYNFYQITIYINRNLLDSYFYDLFTTRQTLSAPRFVPVQRHPCGTAATRWLGRNRAERSNGQPIFIIGRAARDFYKNLFSPCEGYSPGDRRRIRKSLPTNCVSLCRTASKSTLGVFSLSDVTIRNLSTRL